MSCGGRIMEGGGTRDDQRDRRIASDDPIRASAEPGPKAESRRSFHRAKSPGENWRFTLMFSYVWVKTLAPGEMVMESSPVSPGDFLK